MNILGVKINGHDTGAALIFGEDVVAIAEERLNRVKHSPGMFPRLAIDYCLKKSKLKPEEIDMILIDQVNLRSGNKLEDRFKKETKNIFTKAKVHIVNHHHAHAASTFFCSPFEEAAVLVYDGTGEKFRTHLGVYATETDSLYFGNGNNFYQIHKNIHLREGRYFPYTLGIGKLYTRISEYCNFGPYNEGKLMGLAPYGNDSILKIHPYDKWCKEYNGDILCNSQIIYPDLPWRKREFDFSWPTIRRKIIIMLRPIIRIIMRRFTEDGIFEPEIFPPIKLSRPKRTNEKLPDNYYASVAYAAQKVFERVGILLGKQLKNITRSENLCVAGGCGLNIDANMNFLSKVGFKNIFIQPASSDTGIPLGLALYGYHVIEGKPRFYQMKSASMGRAYLEEEILDALTKNSQQIEYNKPENITLEVAKYIADGKIIGWFYGGSEYGPRALGHRSILCDASNKEMKDVLNLKVKHREPWRPFAASVLEERVGDYFEFNGVSPFMVMASNVREEKRDKIPSVTHVDGTCRIQTVNAKDNARYYDLLKNFDNLTGIPVVLNTSFNLGGEPIVENPEDAIRTFLATKMDHLVLDNFIVSKK